MQYPPCLEIFQVQDQAHYFHGYFHFKNTYVVQYNVCDYKNYTKNIEQI